MPTSEQPSSADGTLWQDIRDLTRFVAEAALVSGSIVLIALMMF